MKFKAVSIPKNILLSPKTKAEDMIREFLEANIEVAEVSWVGEYKSASNCCVSINKCAEQKGYPVRCIVRHKIVYIVNTRGDKDE